MEIISEALESITAVVWGERAVSELGSRTVVFDYLFVIQDDDMLPAAERLRDAGFRNCYWSQGANEPSFYKDNGPKYQFIYRKLVHDYSYVDQHTIRFLLPAGLDGDENSQLKRATKVVLLPATYANIDVRRLADLGTSKGVFKRQNNLIWVDDALLLRSFVQTLVREPNTGLWTTTLRSWAISYMYGELLLDDNILDSCGDETAKAYFNKAIDRFGQGRDRITCYKRLGKMPCETAGPEQPIFLVPDGVGGRPQDVV